MLKLKKLKNIQRIHNELSKLKVNFGTNVAQSLIHNIVPNPKKAIVGKANKSVKNTGKKDIKIKICFFTSLFIFQNII